MNGTIEDSKKYLVMLVTSDGYIGQELLPSHCYDQTKGDRKSICLDSYSADKNHIYYVADAGFSPDGEFINENTLHHRVLFSTKKMIHFR